MCKGVTTFAKRERTDGDRNKIEEGKRFKFGTLRATKSGVEIE